MRLASSVLTPRSLRLMTGALAGVAIFAGVGHAGISAYNAVFQAKVRVSVGSQLNLLSNNFKLNNAVELTIFSPTVQPLQITVSNERYISRPQEFALTERYDEELSAFDKSNAPGQIERQAHEFLAARFRAAANGNIDTTSLYAPSEVTMDENLTLDTATPEHASHFDGPVPASAKTERQALVSVLKGEDLRVVAVTPIVAKVTTQPKKSIQPIKQEIKREIKQERQLLVQSEVTSSDKLEYSDLVQLMLHSKSDADAPVTLSAPQKLSDVQPNDVPTTRSATPTNNEETTAKRSDDLPVQTNVDEADGQMAVDTHHAASPQHHMTPSAPLLIQPPVASVDSQTVDSQDLKTSGATVIVGGVVQAPTTTSQSTSSSTIPSGPSGPAATKKVEHAQPTPTPQPEPTPEPKINEEDKALTIHGLDGGDAAQPEATPAPVVVVDSFSGVVAEAFSSSRRAVADARVQILGTDFSVQTDQSGRFVFKNISVNGMLPVVITKDGYLKRRVDLRPKRPAELELVNHNAVALSAIAADEKHDTDGAFIFGQLAGNNSESVEAMKVEVTGPSMARAIYLDANGIPNKQQMFTSARGQFMLLNVVPGTYVLNVLDAFGNERAPHIVHVGRYEGVVRKFNVGQMRFIRGKVMNAMANSANVGGATVQMLGSSKVVETAADGSFLLGPVYVDCSEPAYLQVDKNGFYRNRLDYTCDAGDASRSLFVFSKSYVDGVAIDAQSPLNAAHGIMLGHVSFNHSVKMQLWGPDELSPTSAARGKDFYLDTDGVLNSGLNRSTKNGNFAILEAPEGLSYIQAFSTDNKTLSFWPVMLSPSTVNVYIQ